MSGSCTERMNPGVSSVSLCCGIVPCGMPMKSNESITGLALRAFIGRI